MKRCHNYMTFKNFNHKLMTFSLQYGVFFHLRSVIDPLLFLSFDRKARKCHVHHVFVAMKEPRFNETPFSLLFSNSFVEINLLKWSRLLWVLVDIRPCQLHPAMLEVRRYIWQQQPRLQVAAGHGPSCRARPSLQCQLWPSWEPGCTSWDPSCPSSLGELISLSRMVN